jgi:hypothetical protein
MNAKRKLLLRISALVCLVVGIAAVACGPSATKQASAGVESSQELIQQRQMEAERLDAILLPNRIPVRVDGDTLLIAAPAPKSMKKEEMPCFLHMAEFRQELFKSVRVVVPDMMTRTLQTQFEVTLPISTALPAGCVLPPGTHGIR